MIENLPINNSGTVIDVGCGTGRHVLILSEKKSDWRVIGCDFVKENVDFLNERINEEGFENSNAVCCDATDFSKHLDIEKCEAVIGIGVVQYLTTEKQLREFADCCSEVLNEGGWLVLKHPLSFTESYLLDYHREDMETRYIAKYYNLPDIMEVFVEDFELLMIERTFTKVSIGEKIDDIERDPRARQMWICLEKKK